ncbi:hypothetical protein [Flavisolibacter tropicus]|uniref:Uncharacterized protein n=1 Tax=Flavisolibacter tropicus TaxID=1492898 RepID=A0A172TXJ7_9BACT|nr:hypothetical protein [Flavisolibacter tropicus]ANE51831.1 hypothetical protein SY85_16380 [Flavisolibacter tropicus]
MKPIILLLIVCLSFSKSLMAQLQKDSLHKATNRAHYLKLSKTQKTQASVLLATGGVTLALGGYIWYLAPIAGISETGDVEGAVRTGKTLVVVGSGLAALSIPLFQASRENQRKAELYVGSAPLDFPYRTSKEMLCMGIKIPLL